MPVLERNVERLFVKEAVRRGWLVLKLNVTGHRGWPDRMVVGLGMVRFVELKRPGKKGLIEPMQLQIHGQLRQRGFRVTIVRGPEDFQEALG